MRKNATQAVKTLNTPRNLKICYACNGSRLNVVRTMLCSICNGAGVLTETVLPVMKFRMARTARPQYA